MTKRLFEILPDPDPISRAKGNRLAIEWDPDEFTHFVAIREEQTLPETVSYKTANHVTHLDSLLLNKGQLVWLRDKIDRAIHILEKNERTQN